MNKKNAVRWAVIAGIMLALLVAPAPAAAKEKIEQKFEKTEALARDGKVILSNVSGSVEIKSWAEAQVKIEALKVSQAASKELAAANAEKVQISVQKTGDILRIETQYPDHRSRGESMNVSVHYKIWVPEKAAVKATVVSGTLVVDGIGGAFESNVTSGNVTLSRLSGGADCYVVSGNVKAADLTGDVSLRSVSGGITVERVKGSVETETTSGTIRMTDVSGARSVRGKVLSGNVTYEGTLEKDGKYSLEALSGGLEFTVPADSGFELEAETFSGGITSDFDVTVSGKISRRELRGVVGKGGVSVRLKTFSGSIRIKKK